MPQTAAHLKAQHVHIARENEIRPFGNTAAHAFHAVEGNNCDVNDKKDSGIVQLSTAHPARILSSTSSENTNLRLMCNQAVRKRALKVAAEITDLINTFVGSERQMEEEEWAVERGISSDEERFVAAFKASVIRENKDD